MSLRFQPDLRTSFRVLPSTTTHEKHVLGTQPRTKKRKNVQESSAQPPGLSWRGFLMIGICAVCSMTACDPPTPRFDVPAYHRMQSRYKDLYQIKSKHPLPATDQFPMWSSLADTQAPSLFQPSLVKLQGETWMQAHQGNLFALYFQQKNMQAGQMVVRVAGQIARFVQLWFATPFDEQIHILLSPQYHRDEQNKQSHLPQVGRRQFVLFTGADHDEKLSEYGLVAQITQHLVRLVLTRSLEPNMQKFWQSIAVPAYFDLRGTGAMLSASYDRTTFPKFREILQQSGYPTAQEISSFLQGLRERKTPPLLQQRAIRVACSFLGFLEDAYGQRVMVAFLRYVAKHQTVSWEQSLRTVFGKTEQELWSQWRMYYDPQAWHRQWIRAL